MRLDAFDGSLRDRWTQDGSGWSMNMPTEWMQGRSVFGGLSAAAAVALAQRHLSSETPEDRPLRCMNIQLLRPTVPGRIEGEFEVQREGKSTTFARVTLKQKGQTVLCTQLVFTRQIADATPVIPALTWEGPDPEAIEDLPYMEGITPEFIQHLSVRWTHGAFPFTAADKAQFGGYFRFKIPAGDIEGVLGLLDAWPCPSLAVLDGPAVASTVTWSAHILAIPPRFDGWFAFQYQTIVGRGGFHTAVGHLFGPQGDLIAWSEQLVVVFG